MSTAKSKYLSEISLVQIVATYLVILGHSYPFITDIPDWIISTQVFIYCFHMPLFVWISGYLLIYTAQTSRNNLRAFIKKRCLKLLIPYLALTVIAIVPKYLAQQYLNDSLSLDASSLVRVFLVPRENIWGHFWFLPMIFILGIAGFLIDKLAVIISIKTKKQNTVRNMIWLGVCILLSLAYLTCYGKDVSEWFSLRDIINLGWVFALGAICGCYRLIEKMAGRANVWRAFTLILISISLFVFSKSDITVINSLVKMTIAILMIYALTETCICLSRKLNLNNNALYAQTFTIFLLSWPCQAVINVVTERLLEWPWYVIMPFQFAAGIIGPMLLIRLIVSIERKYNIHWISFTLGK